MRNTLNIIMAFGALFSAIAVPLALYVLGYYWSVEGVEFRHAFFQSINAWLICIILGMPHRYYQRQAMDRAKAKAAQDFINGWKKGGK